MRLNDKEIEWVIANQGDGTLREVHARFIAKFGLDVSYFSFINARRNEILRGAIPVLANRTRLKDYRRVRTSFARRSNILTGGCRYEVGGVPCGAKTLGKICEAHISAHRSEQRAREREVARSSKQRFLKSLRIEA